MELLRAPIWIKKEDAENGKPEKVDQRLVRKRNVKRNDAGCPNAGCKNYLRGGPLKVVIIL